MNSSYGSTMLASLTTSNTQSAAMSDILQHVSQSTAEEYVKFQDLLAQFDAAQETKEEREARHAEEAKAADERKEKLERIQEIRSRIAQLQQRMSAGGPDPAAEAEISMLQTELFWLMFTP